MTDTANPLKSQDSTCKGPGACSRSRSSVRATGTGPGGHRRVQKECRDGGSRDASHGMGGGAASSEWMGENVLLLPLGLGSPVSPHCHAS